MVLGAVPFVRVAIIAFQPQSIPDWWQAKTASGFNQAFLMSISLHNAGWRNILPVLYARHCQPLHCLVDQINGMTLRFMAARMQQD